MIDAGDKRLLDRATPAASGVCHAHVLNGHAKNQGPDWDRRDAAVMSECTVNTTAKMEPLTAVRQQGKVIKAWAASDDHIGNTIVARVSD